MEITIHTERLILRDFELSDYEFYYDLERDELTLKYESDSVPTSECLKERFKEIMDLTEKDKRPKYSLLIERKEDNLPVGRIVIWQIDEKIDEWEMGWAIHIDHTRNGYASEASKALIKFGFKELRANRICANCNDANIPSERVMQKSGMKKEGVLRQTRKLNDKWYGSCIYSVLRSEFTDIL